MFDRTSFRRRPRLLVLPLLLVLTACAAQRSPDPAVPPAAEPGGPPSFLWKATIPGQPGVVYLLGSVHLDQTGAELDRSVTQAVIAADHMVLEIDPDLPSDDVARLFAERGLHHDGGTLADDVRPETLEALRSYLEREGIQETPIMRMRPWMVSITLPIIVMREEGYSPESGVDTLVHRLATSEPTKQRQIHALETPRYQAELIISFEELDPDVLVFETVRALEDGMVEKLFDYYRNGDEQAMTAFLLEGRAASPETEVMYERLLDDRNEAMVAGIMPFFAKDSVTIVTVGAMHMVGEQGILQLLRNNGAEVGNVPRRGPPPDGITALLQPKVETYRSEEAGFAIDLAESVAHMHQEVPLQGGQGGTLRVDFYQAALTPRTTLLISVTSMPAAAEVPPAALEQVALQSLASVQAPARLAEPATVASRQAVRAVGAGEGRSATCWSFAAEGRVFSILSIVGSAAADPEGELKTSEVLDSLEIFEPR